MSHSREYSNSSNEFSTTYLQTRNGETVAPYELVSDEWRSPEGELDVYLVHRGPDTKQDVIEPVAYLLNCLGVKCFSDTRSEPHSMPLGEHNVFSMRKALTFCRFAVVLLSEGFCDSSHCVKEVNTILLRERKEERTIVIPALYTGSLNDSHYKELFGLRSTLLRKSESSQRFARVLVEKILERLQRPVPDCNLLKYYLNQRMSSLDDCEDSIQNLPSPIYTGATSLGTLVSSVSTITVAESIFQWKRPFMIPRQFIEGSIGREQEMIDLHERLWPPETMQEPTKLRGSSVALRGPPGMGKSVLAAMYCSTYGDFSNQESCHYPGGVLWLTIGPQRTSYEDAQMVWQEMVRKVFPEQLLRENSGSKDAKKYEAEDVRNLLAYYPNQPGTLRSKAPMLVVLDDVWGEGVLLGIQEALPLDCAVILTTRDSQVAFKLCDGEQGIISLDVLSGKDAVHLLQSKVKGLEDDVARQLARGMGYHAQALALAAGTLSNRRNVQHSKTTSKIIDDLQRGKAIGRIQRAGISSNKTRSVVEKALDTSYNLLKSDDGTDRWQRQFQILGVFAQEAEFATEAVAHVWKTDAEEAQDFLETLESLALVSVASTDNGSGAARWCQHAVLRAYAIGLWARGGPTYEWRSQHAAFYLDLIKTSMKKRPRDFDVIERDYRQIRHAFYWSRDESTSLMELIITSMSKYLIVRGLSCELESWVQAALERATEQDIFQDKGNILRTMGDIQLQLGKLDLSRRYLEQAISLFDSVHDTVGQALALHSIGDVEYRLGKLTSSRAYFSRSLPLFRRVKNTWGIALVLRSLGDVERFLGNDAAARDYLMQAIDMFLSERNVIGQAGAVLALGRVDARVGKWDDALLHYDQAVSLYEKSKCQLGRASTLKCVADIYLKKAELDHAREIYDRALNLFVTINDRLGEAHTLRCLGDVHFYKGNFDVSKTFLTKALILYEGLSSDRGKANCLRSLAGVELKHGSSVEAQTIYDEAKRLFESIREQLWQNDWKHLDQVEYELQSLDPSSGSTCNSWELQVAIQQPYGRAQTLDVLSEVER